MPKTFKTIGLMGRQRSPDSIDSITVLCDFLSKNKYRIVLEEETDAFLPKHEYPVASKTDFGKTIDLVIVVGGDGSLLNAARLVVDHDIPVLGVNRGRLGFLTDIHPQELTTRVKEVLDGAYFEEKRFLLNAEIRHQEKILHKDMALNDVVLLPGQYTHMIEFEIHINNQLVCRQRADGQIIATPTGSTAYALSGGGPIIHPKLDAIVLVPMLPQTLSSRPIVIDGNSQIDITIIPRFETSPRLSCDGTERIPLATGDHIHIYKKSEQLTLLHPADYSYYETLRKKLFWEQKIS